MTQDLLLWQWLELAHYNYSLSCLAAWVIQNNSWCGWWEIAVYQQNESSHQQILQDVDYKAASAHTLMEFDWEKKSFHTGGQRQSATVNV